MFRGDDDDDFTQGSSSKLASLFGIGKSSQEGNTSLTYTAPKQPKKGRADSQSVKGQAVGQSSSQTAPSSAKLSIIAVKAVHTYKLADGNYIAQGKLGAAVLGNAASQTYQLLLYKGKQQHVTSARISSAFQFVVQANNYATFYDDQMQNWSVMFESSDDAVEFAKEVGLARVNAVADQTDHKLVVQDLLSGVGSAAGEGDVVDVRYIAYPLTAGMLGQEVANTTKSEKPQRAKLRKGSWEEGLLGVAKGCKRMIMLPPFLVGPWKGTVPADASIVLEVDVGRIKSGNMPSLTDSGESALDSSNDDTSIKARGTSISEALTNSPKTNKASIISRMARMGQATLPLKGAIVYNPSDSEETEEELSGPGDTAPSVVSKAPIKMRQSKSQPASSTQNVMMSGGMLPQQLAVYQPTPVSLQPHQFMRADGSVTYIQSQGQLYPLVAQQAVGSQQVFPMPPTAVNTPPAISSPDSHLSVFVAETRTHNSEVRMGMSKVADKVDQVLMKLEGMRHSLPTMSGLMEPSTLLLSIQKLVSENEQLRAELVEKRGKIDLQNEKIYELLHSNQKYLEQRHDMPLQALVLTLQQEKVKLSANLSEAVSRASSLELQVASAGEAGQGLSEEVSAMSSQLKQQQLELENSKQIVQEQEQLMQSYSKSVADLQAIKDELEKKLLESTQQLQEEVHGHELQMNELTKSYQAEITELRKDLESQQQTWSNEVHTLEQENTALRDRVRGLQPHGSSGPAVPNVMAEVKKVMNLVYHTLQPQFVPEASYDGLKIRQTLMATLRDVTLKYIEIKSSTSEHPTDTAHGRHAPAVTPQVVDARVEPAAVTVASETGNGVSTVESSSADRLSAREESNSVSKPIQNPELGIAASCLAETISDGQEKKGNDTEELKRGSLVEKQADSDAQKQDCAGEATTPAGAAAAAAAAMIDGGDITGPAEDGKEKDRHSQESSLESSWRPQPPPPPLFDDDDDDDDWLS